MRIDLATEYFKLCWLIAKSGGHASNALVQARQLAKSGDVHPLVARALEVPVAEMLTDQWRKADDNFRYEVRKAAVAAGTTSDVSWASPLVALQTLLDAALLNLAPFSMLDYLANFALPVPAGVKIAYESGGVVLGQKVGETQWIPFEKMDWSSGTTQPEKCAAMLAVSDDLLHFSPAQAAAFLKLTLGRAVGRATDVELKRILTTGIAPLTTATNPRDDIRQLLAAVPLGSGSRPVLIAAPSLLKQMALWGSADGPPTFGDLQAIGGGSVAGIAAQSSDACETPASPNEHELILVDASRITLDPGVLEVALSQNAALNMADNPSGPANLVSMFQTNSVALRATRYFSASRPIESACAWVKGADYAPA